MKTAYLLLTALPCISAHGHITWPKSTRHGGTLENGGTCQHSECVWFSQPTSIPGKPTLPDYMRSYNVDVSGGEADWSATMPWRAPGTAPVLGSGCGVNGGNQKKLPNGGTAGDQGDQGMDGADLPPQEASTWKRGSTQEVAFGITANHGGGYSYRLCKAGKENVTEQCFQRTPLKFAGDTQWLQYGNFTVNFPYQYDTQLKLERFPMPITKTTNGTFPKGSEWARVPIPGCRICDQFERCGPGLLPDMSHTFTPNGSGAHFFGGDDWYGGQPWLEQQMCAQSCSGLNVSACPPGMIQFPEVLSGISGYTGLYENGGPGFKYSIVDKVIVPMELEPGPYLLSWRWDCEQSHQIWQNCADVMIV